MEVMNRHISYTKPGEGQTVEMPGGELVIRKVAAEQTGGAYSLFEVVLKPKDDEPSHIQHQEDECCYVLEGKFEFSIEGNRIEVGPGSLIYITKGSLHALRNPGNVTGRLLIIQTPGGVYERYVAEVGNPVGTSVGNPVQDNGASPAKETRPVAELTATGAKYGIEIVSLAT